ncbi:TlpA family protein disulfide reductase [Pedobacter sp. ISL-68]|uniref:TlpA family protein disulfide reductase n=1 Tax=unclassified Pedobacter TaxID=2628915 RepID=UPI001BE9C687|nr:MULTISPECIES: TlpA disulfide reductase family protein [unclassified Pedobacter]MBT2563756.1 TlpA family protein disulfide reductase [Pedobacter sp. ISL-64]MBT2589648.1 TlpA family protein disulfide reductase [Pedobacter sp. ISL-68]
MKKTAKYLALALLCLNFRQNATAQDNLTIQPIRVGDKLPASFWTQPHQIYHNGKTTTQTLEAYKGKLLILDFWATWCSSCIVKFASTDSLQKIYGDRLAVILVNAKNTSDTPERTAKTMKRFNDELITVTGDTILTKLFPHRVIPHYVWIQSGQLRSITGSELMTEQSILASMERREILDKKREQRLKKVGKK